MVIETVSVSLCDKCPEWYMPVNVDPLLLLQHIEYPKDNPSNKIYELAVQLFEVCHFLLFVKNGKLFGIEMHPDLRCPDILPESNWKLENEVLKYLPKGKRDYFINEKWPYYRELPSGKFRVDVLKD